jgi:hypothetical protein
MADLGLKLFNEVNNVRWDEPKDEPQALLMLDVTNTVCDHPHQKWQGNPKRRICQICGEDRTKQTGW